MLKSIVINTGPIISLIASDQNLKFMESLYSNIEVVNEIIEGGKSGFGIEHL